MTSRSLLSTADGHDASIRLDAWAHELLWVDLEDPSDAELDEARSCLGIGERTMAAFREMAPRPDATVHDDALQVVVLALADEDGSGPIPLSILLGDGWIVTHHDPPIPFVEEHRERIQDQRETGRLQPIEFLVALLDAWIDTFFHASERLEREVDALDDAALRTERNLLDRLVQLRRRIARVRRILTPHRELLAELVRPDFLPERHRDGAAGLELVIARLDRAVDAFAAARDMLLGTFDVHMTRTAQRTNDVMRVLTLASVILLPAVVIAGVMGMNFKVPLFDQPNVFYLVVAVMLALAIGTLVFAKVRHWF